MPEAPWLVTGGAGFVGRALVARLLDLGRDVVVLDALTWSSHPAAVLDLGAEVLEVDVADGAALNDALDHVCPSVVVHLAMESRVDSALREGAPFLQTNVSGAWNLGRAVAERGLRLVHVSHAGVYGDRSDLPLPDEQSPVRPTTPLGASQACADAIVASLCRSHRLDAVLVRSSNTYGPGQYPEALLPRSARRWADGRTIRLGGEGFQLRDWLHVADHAAGIEAAAIRGESGQLYHLGGGPLRTHREVLLLWRGALGLSGNSSEWSEAADGVPGEDRRQGLDDTASRRALNWAPRWSMEEGLSHTASWLEEHPDFWDVALARPQAQAQLASTWADA